MPQFKFEYRHESEIVEGTSSIEFADLGQAHKYAVLLISKTVRYAEAAGETAHDWRGWFVEIVHGDEKNCKLAVIFPNDRNLASYQRLGRSVPDQHVSRYATSQ